MAKQVIFDLPLNQPGKVKVYQNKQVEIQQGAKLGSITVTGGTLKIAGEIDIGEIIVIDPRLKDGSCADAIWLGNVNGMVESIQTLKTQRDMGKIGQGTHDLVIGHWLGRAVELEDTDFPPGHPPHRDGIQCMRAHEVTIETVDIENRFPGATNGGLWLNPNKADDENVDQNDPNYITNFVVEGGQIIFPNAAIHLGACTGCGARNTRLEAKRPLRVNKEAVDVVDDNNTKIVI
jgi:hypothetical protein